MYRTGERVSGWTRMIRYCPFRLVQTTQYCFIWHIGKKNAQSEEVGALKVGKRAIDKQL